MPALRITTPDGEFTAHYSSRGLCELNFPKAGKRVKTDNAGVPAQIRAWHKVTIAAVRDILAGITPAELPPLDLSVGTDFQQAVWKAMLKIPCGRTLSYGEIARVIGRPNAVRAVGGACGANPIPLIVPCHRVLAANHRLGGFSGGLDWKRKLLARERVEFVEPKSAETELFAA